jgi:V/A-type H+-transporting ATPase subunit E
MPDTTKLTGIQELIDRLRDDGVKAGQEEADQLLRDAHEKAAGIVAQAKTEAAEMLAKARNEIETEKSAAMASLKVAIRDTELKMEAELKADFAAHVKRLVSVEMRDVEFLRQIIVAIAGLAAGDKACGNQSVNILLPENLFHSDAKGPHLTEEGRENFRRLVLGISGDMLREGVNLMPSDRIDGGIRLQLVGEDMEIDLSDKAISELLLQIMLPRYRAIVAGAE